MKYLGILLFSFIFVNATPQVQTEALNLNTAIEKALEQNYHLNISKKEVEIAELNDNWGKAGRYPSVDFNVSSTNRYDFDENTTNAINTGISLNWTIFDGFRVNITKDQLELFEELSHGNLAVDIENTIEDVILAYHLVLLNKEKLEVFKKLMELSADRFAYEQQRHELGGSPSYAVLQSKNVFLSDKAQYIKQQAEVRNSARMLYFLLGEERNDGWDIEGQMTPDTTAYVLADLMEKMQSNNQVLKNQYINSQIKQKQIDLNQSDLYPYLRISSGMENSYNRNSSPSITGSSVTTRPYANINLLYEIYKAGNRKRSIEIAKITSMMAEVETEKITHSLSNELLYLYENYTYGIELVKVAEERLETAELNLQIAGDKLRTGAISSFDFRDIQLIYLNAAIDRLSAIYDLKATHIALTRITGGFLVTEAEN